MKNKRHEKIISLITRYEIETQEELIGMLYKEGFTVTQATALQSKAVSSSSHRTVQLCPKPTEART